MSVADAVAVAEPAAARASDADLAAQVELLTTQLRQEFDNNELLQQAVGDLQRALYEPGWIQFVQTGEHEFTPEAMVQMRAICRLYALKSPLIKRGLGLRSGMVWGQGVEITARANGRRKREQDVQAVVRAFLTDPANERTFTGAQARDQLETFGFGTDGEIFVALFTRPTTGHVRARVLPADEIVDIITDPEDAATPWFYLRRWTQVGRDADGNPTREHREQLYPSIDYRPRKRPKKYGRWPVDWWAPVAHAAVNQPLGWQRGVPDAYAAIDWARAYKIFLEDWATLMRSLARYAWKATAPGANTPAVRRRIAEPPSRSAATGESNHAGATAVLSADHKLEAVSKSGATLDADSGRPVAAMVAAALDIPVTMLLADPGVTGARATAETLRSPTEESMGQRRDLWAGFLQRIVRYVITEAVRAPKGPLKGTLSTDPYTGGETLLLDGKTDASVDVTWPRFRDADISVIVSAVAAAAGTGTIPPEVTSRLLLTALGVRDVDELVEKLVGAHGEFLWPTAPPLGGSRAGDAWRAGKDPADVGGSGRMAPDDEEVPGGDDKT